MSSKSPHKKQATSSATGRDSWAKVRLGNICEIVRGVSYKKDQASEQPEKGKVPILRATNIQECTLVLDSNLVHVPSTVVSEEQMLQVGDIVVATSSGSKHLVGKTAQVKQAWEGSFGAFCATLRPKVDIDHRYLGYFFGTQEYKDYISKKALGVNINNLRRGDLEEISVPVAPPEQQKCIVAKIEKQFSRLDEAVTNLKRIKANLKRYKAAVLKAAVEGKLTEDWRKAHPNVEPASQLLERLLPAKNFWPKAKSATEDTIDLFPVPESWVWCKASHLAEVVDPQPSHRTPKDAPGGVPYIGMGDVNKNGQIDFPEARKVSPQVLEEHRQRYQLRIGDFIFGKIGTLGAPVRLPKPFDYTLSANVVLFQPNLKITYSEFLFNYMRSPYVITHLTKKSKATSQPAFGIQKVREIPVSLPSMEEQTQIVAEVERRLSIIEELEATVEANLTRANRLRQSFLQAAFCGKLTGPISVSGDKMA